MYLYVCNSSILFCINLFTLPDHRVAILSPFQITMTSPLLLLFFLLLSANASSSSSAAPPPSAYEVLQQYEFPVGLLPEGITRYDLDEDTGRFSAQRDGTCSFEIQSKYMIRYEPTIEGVISRGKIEDLKGVSVRVMSLVWLGVVRVVRAGPEIEFSVGVASAGFPVENFEECPRCGCGLDCKNKTSSPSWYPTWDDQAM